eukprot:751261-Hanusia_phi.AAC.2
MKLEVGKEQEFNLKRVQLDIRDSSDLSIRRCEQNKPGETDAPYLCPKFIGVIEVIEEFCSHHNTEGKNQNSGNDGQPSAPCQQ